MKKTVHLLCQSCYRDFMTIEVEDYQDEVFIEYEKLRLANYEHRNSDECRKVMSAPIFPTEEDIKLGPFP